MSSHRHAAGHSRPRPLWAALLLAGCVAKPCTTRAQLLLTEACTNNYQVLATPTGDHADWIEVYNAGSEAIQLGMYHLSDRANMPFRWRLPDEMLAPGAYRVFFAAEGDLTPDRFPFGLPASGGTVFLSDVNGSAVDHLSLPALQMDHSFGTTPQGGTGIFRVPTPGAANLTDHAPGYSPAPVFTPPPGPCSGPVHVALSAASAVSIRYTTDGTDPQAAGTTYNAGIPLSTSTVIKAVATEPGLWPSAVATASYLVGATHDLPVMSIAVDPDSMFHPELGIYMLGPGAAPDYPHWGANFWSDRDITADIQFFEADGRLVVDQRVDLRIHGGTRSRNMPQRPLRLTARGRYGKATIEHTFFPEKPTLAQHQRLVLRNAGADFCLGQLRDAVFHQAALHEHLDIDVLAYRPCLVYINGVYWGLMDVRERIDAEHLHFNYGADPDSLLLMEEENGPINGDPVHFDQLQQFIRTHDLNDPQAYAWVTDQLDISSLQDYFALQIFAGNADWPANNLKYWKPSPTRGKWRYLLYDLDATMNIYGWIPMDYDEFWAILVHRAGWIHSEVFRGLLGNAEFRRTFINRLADLLNTSFSTPTFQQEVDAITDRIGGAIPDHFLRWGCSPADWTHHAFGLAPTFANTRPAIVRDHVLATFALPTTVDLEVMAFPPGAGRVRINSIRPELPFHGTYFHGNAMDLIAEAGDGYRFDHWGTADGQDLLGNLPDLRHDFASPTAITAHFRPVDEDLFLYPNPTHGDVQLDLSGWPVGQGHLEVLDAAGRLLRRMPLDHRMASSTPSIALHDLAAGLYLVTCEIAGMRRSTLLVRATP